jgi:hypothetical protein
MRGLGFSMAAALVAGGLGCSPKAEVVTVPAEPAPSYASAQSGTPVQRAATVVKADGDAGSKCVATLLEEGRLIDRKFACRVGNGFQVERPPPIATS